MSDKKVGLDIDGVLANWYLGICKLHNQPYVAVDKWDIPWLVEKMQEENDHKELHGKFPTINEKLIATLPRLTDPEELQGINVDCYISAIPKQYESFRKAWLTVHGFPEAPLFLVENSEDKIHIIRERGLDYFVDDKPSTIKDLVKLRKEEQLKCHPTWFVPKYYSHDMFLGIIPGMRFITNMFELKMLMKDDSERFARQS